MAKTRTSGAQKNAGVSMGPKTSTGNYSVKPKVVDGKWNLEGTASNYPPMRGQRKAKKPEQGIGTPASRVKPLATHRSKPGQRLSPHNGAKAPYMPGAMPNAKQKMQGRPNRKGK